MSKLIKLSIEVTAIPKDKIKAHTNGKSYVSIDCWVNDEPDRFGKDVSLNIQAKKNVTQKHQRFTAVAARLNGALKRANNLKR